MSKPCEITGLSAQNIEKYSYLHAHLTGNLNLQEPSEESLNGFNKPLLSIVSANKVHSGDSKRKESLFKHLEKSVASKFEGAKLSAFGSTESGLSLKGGDFDLCLQKKLIIALWARPPKSLTYRKGEEKKPLLAICLI